MKKYLPVFVLIVLALTLAACGGNSSEEAADEGASNVTLDVVENDIYFGDANDNVNNPPTWNVSAGSEVTVNITNNGALEHNFAIIQQGESVPNPFVEADSGDIILQDSGLTQPGESATFSFTAPDPGEYQVICTVAGHYPLMQGRLVVE